MSFKEGQRVRLVGITQDLIASGVKLGMIGTVCVEGPFLNGPGFTGVEFEGHSDTGYNAGLRTVCVNTRRDGQVVPVISLCEPLE